MVTNERGEGAVMCDKSIQLQHNQFVLRVGWEAQGMGDPRGVGAKGGSVVDAGGRFGGMMLFAMILS